YTFRARFSGNTLAQSTMIIDLQHSRIKQADCPRRISRTSNLHFCSKTAWRECAGLIISSDRFVAADRLNDVAYIAIDLGLCCQFFRYVRSYVESVGSCMRKNGTTLSICLGVGAGNLIASTNAATHCAN
ncbi:hypothetical protein COCC4DRAFT_155005, partial [Bipolaris maydis ATCC 48331]